MYNLEDEKTDARLSAFTVFIIAASVVWLLTNAIKCVDSDSINQAEKKGYTKGQEQVIRDIAMAKEAAK